ncbi:MAG: RHS repeat-associated core domain-containing protein [Cyclobacteriaceae bacterium]
MNKGKNFNNYQFTGDFMYSKITNAANNAWQELAAEKTMDQAGYVYIYTATESNTNVDIYFDDFDIQLEQTHIVAGNDYYPFGLSIVERSYEKQDYRYDYQGQYAEKDDETGYNAFQLRMYDARIGRWISPDPYGQFFSAYVAMGNNPIIMIDPTGGFSGGCTAYDELVEQGAIMLDDVVEVSATFLGGEIFKEVVRVSADVVNSQMDTRFQEYLFQQVQNHVDNLNYVEPKDPFLNHQTYLDVEPQNMFGEWEASNNILKSTAYDIADAFYVTGHFFTPWRDARHLNNDGIQGSDKVDAFAEATATAVPIKVTGLATGFRTISKGFITKFPKFRFQFGKEFINPIAGRGASGSIKASHINIDIGKLKLHVILNPKRWKYLSTNKYSPFRIHFKN